MENSVTKVCSKCKVEKTVGEFFTNRGECKQCTNKYRDKNKEKIAASRKRWNDENREHVRNYKYKVMYGITLTEYNNILEYQDGKCVICGEVKKCRSRSRQR